MKPFYPFTNFTITSQGRLYLDIISDEMIETIEYVKCMTDKSMPFHLCYAEEIMAEENENEQFMPTGYLPPSQTSKHESNLFNLTNRSKVVQNEKIKKYGRKQDQKPKYGKPGRPKKEKPKNVQ